MHLGVLVEGQHQKAIGQELLHLAIVEQLRLGRLRAIVRRSIGAALRLEMARERAEAPSAVLGHAHGDSSPATRRRWWK